jgi:hypothetical protein
MNAVQKKLAFMIDALVVRGQKLNKENKNGTNKCQVKYLYPVISFQCRKSEEEVLTHRQQSFSSFCPYPSG